jgi:hypothetical protein
VPVSRFPPSDGALNFLNADSCERPRMGNNIGHRINWTVAWSTGASTSTSTESLPVDWPRPDNSVISVQECSSAPTITRSIWVRIPTSIHTTGVQIGLSNGGPLANDGNGPQERSVGELGGYRINYSCR